MLEIFSVTNLHSVVLAVEIGAAANGKLVLTVYLESQGKIAVSGAVLNSGNFLLDKINASGDFFLQLGA